MATSTQSLDAAIYDEVVAAENEGKVLANYMVESIDWVCNWS
jgi:hypothetical protein